MTQSAFPWLTAEPLLRPEVAKMGSRRARLQALLAGDLDFHGTVLAAPIHQVHPFPAKFPPALPRLFIQYLTTPGERVLDPMMGSGTTIVEAQRLGRQSLGGDIDPLALHLVRAKISPPSTKALATAVARTLERAETWLAKREAFADYRRRWDTATREFVDYWFLPQTQQELWALQQAIRREPKQSLHLWLQVLFSGIIIAKSSSVALARDLSHTRPHKVNKHPRSALQAFQMRARRVLRILSAYVPQSAPRAHLWAGDAQSLPLEANSVDLIVTSPPYASNAIDYMRAHKFTLVWWGYPLNALTALRREYIGGEALSGVTMEPLPEIARQAIARVANKDSRKGRVLQRYFSEMRRALHEMKRVLRPGGVAVLVVGDATMRGLSTQTPQSLAVIGQQVGLDWAGTGVRHLDRDRRMMPARADALQTTQIEQRMHQEYVLGFIKPGETP